MPADRLGLPDLHEISDLLLRSALFSFRGASWTMYPALWKRDQRMVEPVSPTQLHIGGLILFHRRGRLICRRRSAIERAEAGVRFVTKGDAVAGCDGPLAPDQVLGRVVELRPGGLWARCPPRSLVWSWKATASGSTSSGSPLPVIRGPQGFQLVARLAKN